MRRWLAPLTVVTLLLLGAGSPALSSSRSHGGEAIVRPTTSAPALAVRVVDRTGGARGVAGLVTALLLLAALGRWALLAPRSLRGTSSRPTRPRPSRGPPATLLLPVG